MENILPFLLRDQIQPHPTKVVILSSRQAQYSASSLLALRTADAGKAWNDARSRGKEWTNRARQGLEVLNQIFPKLDVKDWLNLGNSSH